MRNRPYLITLLALVLIAAPAFSADAAWDRARILGEAKKVTREAYPNADDVLVYDLIRARYNPNGTSVTTDDTWVKVLTEAGKRSQQQLVFHFTIPYSRVRIDAVEIVKPDGKVVAVDVKKQSRVMVDRSQMGQNIFNPNRKLHTVNVPGLEIGDVLRYKYARETVKARVPDTWSDWMVFEHASPIVRFIYEVDAPRERPLKSIALRDEVKGTVTYTRSRTKDRLLYRWVVRSVPRAFREPAMPPLHTCAQRLLVSTIPDWREISRWYWRLSEPHFKATDKMKAKVAELTKGLDDRQKKIEAVFRFVAQDVRYMGITTEKTAPGYEPHDAADTFENRHGVCRDKAALLVAMLQIAGIDSFPVLIHNGPKKDMGVPQPWFNHAITAVARPGGGYQLMDSTDENSRDLFPSYLSNQSYLVAKSDGETLLTSPTMPPEKNLVRIKTHGALDAKGNLTLESTLRFDGINDGAYRGYFTRIKPEERRRFFEGIAKRVATGAKLVEFDIKPGNLRDMSQPFQVRLKLTAPGVLISDGKTAMLPVPRFGTRVGLVNFILRNTGLKKRRFPLVTKYACGVEEELSLDVSKSLGAPIALPKFERVDDKTLTYAQTLVQKGATLKGHTRFHLKAVEFSPRQYLALKETLKKLEYNGRKMPVFEARKAAAKADVDILDVETAYDVADAHNWTRTRSIRLRILTYAGKKRRSELKLNYNPVWETVELLAATVTNPDGTVKKVSDEEKNIMDAAWVGSAPRYPAAKTLVISLPGVEVGSVIQYRVRRTVKDRPFFSARHALRQFDPIGEQRVIIDAPKTLKLKIDARMTRAFKATSRSLSATRVRRTWIAKDATPLKREGFLPPWWVYQPSVSVSSGDWTSYAATVRAALIAAATGQPGVAARARELVKGAKDEAAKIKAVRDFVAREIQDAGPSLHELPLSAVTPADRILKEGYGNTSDSAVILYAMLKAVGIEGRFVLASQHVKLPGTTTDAPPFHNAPATGDFPGVLVRVGEGARSVYLNDSDQYGRLGATYYDGYVGLDATTGRMTEIWARHAERQVVNYDVTISANGDARIVKTEEYRGTDYGEFHRQFAEMTPEERRRHHQKAVSSIAQSATADGGLITDTKAYPGKEQLAVQVKGYAVRDGDYLYFRLPHTLGALMNLRSDTRDNPFYRGAPVDTEILTRLRVPKAFAEAVLVPKAVRWTDSGDDAVSVTRYHSTGEAWTVLTFRHKARLHPKVVPVEGYAKLLKLQRTLSHPSARMVLVKKAK